MENVSIGRRNLVLAASTGLIACLISRSSIAELICQDEGADNSCDARIKTSDFARVKALQETTVWCWAAALQMIFQWSGKKIQQEDIVKQTFGELLALPANPYVLMQSVNREYQDEAGARFRVNSKVWSTDFGVAQINDHSMIDSLSANRPMVICNDSHMMVLVGLNYVKAKDDVIKIRLGWVADPMLIGSVTNQMGAARLAPGFRYLTPAELTPMSHFGGRLRFVADLNVS